jgi:hypothetical protein
MQPIAWLLLAVFDLEHRNTWVARATTFCDQHRDAMIRTISAPHTTVGKRQSASARSNVHRLNDGH